MFILSFSCLGVTSIPHCITIQQYFFKIHFPHAKGDKISFVVFVARVSKDLPRNEFFQILKKWFQISQIFPILKILWKFDYCKIWHLEGDRCKQLSTCKLHIQSRQLKSVLIQTRRPIKMRHFSDETKYWVLIHFDGHF